MPQTRREICTGLPAVLAGLLLSGGIAGASAVNRKNRVENEMSNNGIFEWEDLLDQLRPLGQLMRDRIPERLRSDPRVMQESMRLLLSGVLRTTRSC